MDSKQNANRSSYGEDDLNGIKKIKIKMKKFFVFIAGGGMLKDFILIASRKIKKSFFGKIEKGFWKN